MNFQILALQLCSEGCRGKNILDKWKGDFTYESNRMNKALVDKAEYQGYFKVQLISKQILFL